MIEEVFKSKDWNILDETFNKALISASKIYRKLNSKEKSLFINLLEIYEVVTYNDYLEYVKNASELLTNQLITNEKILFLPLLSKEEVQLEKGIFLYYHAIPNSSTFLLYLNRILEVQANRCNRKKPKYNFFRNIYEQSFISAISSKSRLVILDDFSGTGKSIIKTLDLLHDLKKENPEEFSNVEINVLVLFTTNKAVNELKKKYPKIMFIYVRETVTLDEIFVNNELKDYKDLIDKINKKTDIRKKPYGFSDSYALISLLRTPNNTISFFHSGKNPLFKRDNNMG